MSLYYHNGQFTSSLALPVTDRCILHGLGLFETLLAIDGATRHLDLHLARLNASCRRLGWSAARVDPTVLHELLERNHLTHGRARIRITLTAGSGVLHHMGQGDDASLILSAAPTSHPEGPARITISSHPVNERSPLAGMKTTCYAENLCVLAEARAAGYDEALRFNTRDHLCEGASSNVFIELDGSLVTPPLASGCLPGITRSRVLAAAIQSGRPATERDLTRDDLARATSAFLTSSIQGVREVSCIGSRQLATPALIPQFAD